MNNNTINWKQCRITIFKDLFIQVWDEYEFYLAFELKAECAFEYQIWMQCIKHVSLV